MKFRFTEKAERFHVGTTGEIAKPESDSEQREWLMNEFIEIGSPVVDATVVKPASDGMVRKSRK